MLLAYKKMKSYENKNIPLCCDQLKTMSSEIERCQ